MGPRRIRRGEQQTMWGRAATVQASMGPRRIRRGERVTLETVRIACSELQWGHGELAVETISDREQQAGDQPLLQWGHGEFAVENPAGGSRFRGRARGFNGATANSPWRTGSAYWIRKNLQPASMGPRR